MHDFTASQFSFTVFRWSSSREVFPKSDMSCFILCQRACENTWIFLGTFLVYTGMTSLSAMMAPSWSDTPGTVVMCLTKAGLFVMKRSSMLPSLVVSFCSCDRLFSCRMPMNFSLACFRLAPSFTASSSHSYVLEVEVSAEYDGLWWGISRDLPKILEWCFQFFHVFGSIPTWWTIVCS